MVAVSASSVSKTSIYKAEGVHEAGFGFCEGLVDIQGTFADCGQLAAFQVGAQETAHVVVALAPASGREDLTGVAHAENLATVAGPVGQGLRPVLPLTDVLHPRDEVVRRQEPRLASR